MFRHILNTLIASALFPVAAIAGDDLSANVEPQKIELARPQSVYYCGDILSLTNIMGAENLELLVERAVAATKTPNEAGNPTCGLMMNADSQSVATVSSMMVRPLVEKRYIDENGDGQVFIYAGMNDLYGDVGYIVFLRDVEKTKGLPWREPIYIDWSQSLK